MPNASYHNERLEDHYKHCQNLTSVVHFAAETRFYGAHIVAQRLVELRAAIMQTVVCQEWTDWVKKAAAKIKDEAAVVKALALDEKKFWGKLEVMVDVFEPVVKLVRLADSAVPASSKVSSFGMHFFPFYSTAEEHYLVQSI